MCNICHPPFFLLQQNTELLRSLADAGASESGSLASDYCHACGLDLQALKQARGALRLPGAWHGNAYTETRPAWIEQRSCTAPSATVPVGFGRRTHFANRVIEGHVQKCCMESASCVASRTRKAAACRESPCGRAPWCTRNTTPWMVAYIHSAPHHKHDAEGLERHCLVTSKKN